MFVPGRETCPVFTSELGFMADLWCQTSLSVLISCDGAEASVSSGAASEPQFASSWTRLRSGDKILFLVWTNLLCIQHAD